MLLSAKGITESGPVQEIDTAPFDLVDDDQQPDEAADINSTGQVDLLAVVSEWARLQRKAYDDLLEHIRVFGYVPKSRPRPKPAVPTPQMFPADLLARSLENILVNDSRLGLPPGCIKILNDAGIVSAAMLAQHITEQTLVKIPRIGKAKAAVISETMRAFEAARKSHESTPN